MTTEHEASRTLVKSPPELWAECSDPGSLARHLGEFGEITITRLEPENAVAWEGEHASGTVRIEPAGWGTRVTLTAHTKGEAAGPEPEEPEGVEAEAEVEAAAELEAAAEVDAAAEERPEEEPKADATPEATPDPDPIPIAENSRGRARWRRLTARVRRAFAGSEPDEEPDVVTTPEEPLAEPLPVAQPLDEAEPEGGAQLEGESQPEAESQRELEPDPAADSEPDPEPSRPDMPAIDASAILTSALDSLGQAHHRPFSRA
jgi:hypothetical protein